MENVENGDEKKMERRVLGEVTNTLAVGEAGRRRRKPVVEEVKRAVVDIKRKKVKEMEVKASRAAARYSADIYEYLRALEKKHLLKADHLAKSHITDRMRQIVIDWLLDVQIHFKLDQETLELTVAILDRYLAEESSVDRSNLQLVTMAALFIAIKYQETFLLDLSDLRFICDYSFSEEEILDMERKVLITIDFNLSYPSRSIFVRKLLTAMDCDERLVLYLLDLSLLECSLASVEPSKVAAACVYISICLTISSIAPWSRGISVLSNYSLLDLHRPVMVLARRCISSAHIEKGGIFNKHLKQHCGVFECVRSPSYLDTLSQVCAQVDVDFITIQH